MASEKANERKYNRCPLCGAPISSAKQYFIDWDQDKKEFLVQLAFFCPPCHHRFEENLVKHLPVIIANDSLCSCGAKLILKDYTFRRTTNDIEFEGVYVCSNCTMKKRTILGNIKQGLEKLWGNTTKLEVGLAGVKYEKKGGTEAS